MPIQFIKPTIEEARRMWAIKPFVYERGYTDKQMMGLWRFDCPVCTCSQISTTLPPSMIFDKDCPVHGKTAH